MEQYVVAIIWAFVIALFIVGVVIFVGGITGRDMTFKKPTANKRVAPSKHEPDRFGQSVDMRACPLCRERIQEGALKCKHCGGWLGVPARLKKVIAEEWLLLISVFSGVGCVCLILFLTGKHDRILEDWMSGSFGLYALVQLVRSVVWSVRALRGKRETHNALLHDLKKPDERISILLPYYLGQSFCATWEADGFRPVWAENAEELQKIAATAEIDLAIEWQYRDWDFPVRDLLRKLRKNTPMFLCLNWRVNPASDIRAIGYADSLEVPFNEDEMTTKFLAALPNHRHTAFKQTALWIRNRAPSRM